MFQFSQSVVCQIAQVIGSLREKVFSYLENKIKEPVIFQTKSHKKYNHSYQFIQSHVINSC